MVVILLASCGASSESDPAPVLADQSAADASSPSVQSSPTETGEHPNLILTPADVDTLRSGWRDVPLFESAVQSLITSMEARIVAPIDVPVPADAGGGYTHEQHKSNYKTIYEAGLLYQITAEQKYADHAKSLFLEYAELYPTLGEHPQKKEQTPGRLFWQSLNESVWLVYGIQGYDLIAAALSDAERDTIEQNLLRPLADFLSEGQPETFNKIHNHGTWAAAGVGMTGYVLGDQEYVEKALLGLDKSGTGGFLRQIDELFSPDGYYNEGPYYQRYALMPFVLFAKAIQTNEPERDIFSYREGLLLKAVYAALQLSYNGLFFPINDALPDKGIDTTELVIGVAIAYGITNDPGLLSVVESQGSIDISADGFALARALQQGEAETFPYRSMNFADGAEGDRGALAILRSGSHEGHQALVMKNTAQGLGHGHFDKLSWLFYDSGNMIVTDYGAARFLNIEAKYGGHYLPENDTWAKQTIAHNTLVVDETSHFDGELALAETISPRPRLFDIQDDIEIVSAEVQGAYPDVAITRTMALIKADELDYPLVVDVLHAASEGDHQYDLPLHYRGHIVELNFDVEANDKEQRPLSEDNGYEYLWLTASAQPEQDLSQITWLKDNRFYTYSMLGTEDQQLLFTRLGANDPNFNLRPETAVIQRVQDAGDHSFVSLLETHGEYNPVLEYTVNSHSQINELTLNSSDDVQAISFVTHAGVKRTLLLAYEGDEMDEHEINIDGRLLAWQGRYSLVSWD